MEQVERKMSKNSLTSSKNVATELMIGAALAAKQKIRLPPIKWQKNNK